MNPFTITDKPYFFLGGMKRTQDPWLPACSVHLVLVPPYALRSTLMDTTCILQQLWVEVLDCYYFPMISSLTF